MSSVIQVPSWPGRGAWAHVLGNTGLWPLCQHPARFAGRHKRAKLLQRSAFLYNGIQIGPKSLPPEALSSGAALLVAALGGAGLPNLVQLAPAMPGRAAPFNRNLARKLLVQALKGWALGAGASLLLAALSGADASMLLRVDSICCLVLPLLATPLRNHARRATLSVLVPLPPGPSRAGCA